MSPNRARKGSVPESNRLCRVRELSLAYPLLRTDSSLKRGRQHRKLYRITQLLPYIFVRFPAPETFCDPLVIDAQPWDMASAASKFVNDHSEGFFVVQ